MATTITPEELFFGAPASLTVGGTEVGATVDPPKVSIDITEYTPDFQGARGPVKSTKNITKVLAKVSFRVNQFTAEKLGWSMPGSVSTTGAGTPTSGGANTTLAADTALGATSITVASATGIAAGNILRIGDAGNREVRHVGAGYVSGTTIPLDAALLQTHDSGDQVLELDDIPETTTTWTPGRVPSDAYKDVVLRGEGVDGAYLEVQLDDALSTLNSEMEFGDSAIAGMPVEFVAHYDPDAPTVAPFRIITAPAA